MLKYKIITEAFSRLVSTVYRRQFSLHRMIQKNKETSAAPSPTYLLILSSQGPLCWRECTSAVPADL